MDIHDNVQILENYFRSSPHLFHDHLHKAAEISLTTKSISDVTGGMLNVQMMEQLGRNGITSLLIPLKVASEINACDHQ
jgi:hypothetical protein